MIVDDVSSSSDQGAMARRRLMLILALLIFLIGAFCLAANWSGQQGSTPVHAQILGLTNGTVGTMSTFYGGLSSNYAIVVRDWMERGTNTLLVHIVNEGPTGVWLFPFATIEDTEMKRDAALLLNAPNYSGILLPAHSSTNVEVAIFQPTSGRVRARLGYTRDTSADSFVRRLSRLPKELTATLMNRQPFSEQTTPIETEWVVEDSGE